MAVPAYETCRGIYTSATDHVAVVLGPPRNAVGAATLGRDSTVQSENELPRGDTRPHGRAASPSSCCRWRSAAARSWATRSAPWKRRERVRARLPRVEIRRDRAQATRVTLGC